MSTETLIEKLEAAKLNAYDLAIERSHDHALEKAIAIVRQHQADHSGDANEMVSCGHEVKRPHTRSQALMYSALLVLRPIAEQDWHGKWRVQKAIQFLEADSTVPVEQPQEVVERVAEAIVDAIVPHKWLLADEKERKTLRRMAKAAITAYEEPGHE